MPRKQRQRSETDIYHVMLRGINHQYIFEDDDDYSKFLELIIKYKEKTNTVIYSYCLMNNHIHLLVKSINISSFVRKIAAEYVCWFNWKYNRSGGLLQDRFKSEPVENDKYFLTVLRYIHNNPVNAGITDNVDKYKYCSYHDYVDHRFNCITDVNFALGMLSQKQFINYHNKASNDNLMDIDKTHRITDTNAIVLIKKISNISNLSEIYALSLNNRNASLKAMKKEGLSVRQIERLTGLNRGVVLKA